MSIVRSWIFEANCGKDKPKRKKDFCTIHQQNHNGNQKIRMTVENHTNFSSLLPQNLKSVVDGWIQDDMPSFDVGGLVVGNETKQAQLLMKSSGVFAGKPFFDIVFESLGCQVEWEEIAVEGVYNDISGKVKFATVTGPVHMLLRGERTALNTLSRCSGVATISREASETAKKLGWNGWVAGTRKTTPGFRIVEKYGLLVGGAATHRLVSRLL